MENQEVNQRESGGESGENQLVMHSPIWPNKSAAFRVRQTSGAGLISNLITHTLAGELRISTVESSPHPLESLSSSRELRRDPQRD